MSRSRSRSTTHPPFDRFDDWGSNGDGTCTSGHFCWGSWRGARSIRSKGLCVLGAKAYMHHLAARPAPFGPSEQKGRTNNPQARLIQGHRSVSGWVVKRLGWGVCRACLMGLGLVPILQKPDERRPKQDPLCVAPVPKHPSHHVHPEPSRSIDGCFRSNRFLNKPNRKRLASPIPVYYACEKSCLPSHPRATTTSSLPPSFKSPRPAFKSNSGFESIQPTTQKCSSCRPPIAPCGRSIDS